MSLRWRADGRLLCGAKTEPKKDDCYIDDRLHYHLSMTGVIEPASDESDTGLWHWREPRKPYWEETTMMQCGLDPKEALCEHQKSCIKDLQAENTALAARVAGLMEALEAVQEYLRTGKWDAARGGVDTAITKALANPDERAQRIVTVVEAAQELQPHVDKLVCYASTTKEFPLNGIVKCFNEALDALKETDGC